MKRDVVVAAMAAAIALGGRASAQEATVRVHLEGDPRLVLETRVEGGWTPICQAPCDQRVSDDALYRVNGDGIQPSRKFALPSTYGEAVVVAAPGSAGLHTFGLVTIGLGAAAFIAGLQTMLVAVLTETCGDCIGGFANTTAPNVAWALMGGGVLALIGGGIAVGESKTQVDLTTQDLPRAAATVIPERRVLAPPPAVGVPVFGFSF